jgi:hypothetical protein
MKYLEDRKRVVIEEVQPQIDADCYTVKVNFMDETKLNLFSTKVELPE